MPHNLPLVESSDSKPIGTEAQLCNLSFHRFWYLRQVLDPVPLRDQARTELSIYFDTYVIDDNTFLDPEYIANIKSEYTGVF